MTGTLVLVILNDRCSIVLVVMNDRDSIFFAILNGKDYIELRPNIHLRI